MCNGFYVSALFSRMRARDDERKKARKEEGVCCISAVNCLLVYISSNSYFILAYIIFALPPSIIE